MRVLWTVNLVPQNAAKILSVPSEVLGGWVESMATGLSRFDDISLAMACKTENSTEFEKEIDGVSYFSLVYPKKNTLSALEDRCRQIIKIFNPDIIQIEGTEFLHAKAMVNVASEMKIPTIASMQGILNGQYSYQCGELPIDDMLLSRSITNILAGYLLHLRKTRWYKPRMKPEKEVISKVGYILGRTTWDRAHSYAHNPNAKYFSCNRILRTPFYNTNWSPEKAERHSIYVGNGYMALKGLHFVVMALPELIREYPDIKVYVAGHKPFTENDKRPFYKKMGYGAYLKKLIKDLGVGGHIIFTGPLQANEVAEKLATVNAYVLCSTVENSPNTLGEAMLVGTPCVASYVGGAPDMADDGEEALFYRSNDPALLAWAIKRIFDSDELALSLSENAKKRAEITHSPEKNADELIYAYTEIMKGQK